MTAAPGWFHVRPVSPGAWLVAEPSHVNGWLVAGRDRAVLVDTGLGIAPVRPLAEATAGLPVDAVNTHHHFDHVGGNAEFDDVAVHERGIAPLAAGAPPAERAGYLAHTRGLLAAAATYRDLDQRFFHLLGADSDPRPLPDGFDAEAWVRPGPPAGPVPRALRDGDVIDLGGRSLTVIHTPGHSPDSICLLDDRGGLLFAGDTVNSGPIYAQAPESDLEDFARSTARLAGMAGDVSLVAMGHFGRGVAEPRHLADVAEAFDRVLSGDRSVAFRVQCDCDDVEVREAVFGQFSILLDPD
ncbi:MBL fold metallo-hydrolase [Actinomycetospora endophytica]|uniref:MBL fold metallo-hydrolase n=1 Tax=Actinomycetospora endophytica TaxID=2291215 RepID=A0ABS8P4J9_9PSEU|nr:MBL fold metallo-hydrolase [Actinomycetospora endophytica]MCD2193185.1 MBL fold metallo-hydrolase [Actinomycetospora endophytica]